MSWWSRSRGPRLCGLLLSLLAIPLPAAEWTLRPALQLSAGYDSNLRLTPLPHDPVREHSLSPRIDFSWSTPRHRLDGQLQGSLRRYSDRTTRGRNIGGMTLGYQYGTERGAWTLGAGITRDTTLDEELEATGLAVERATRLNRSVNAGWNRALSERSTLNLGYSYSDSSYGGDTLSDYRIHSVTAGAAHQWTERTGLNASLAASRYRNADGSLITRNVSLQAGLSRNFSETLQASLSAGLRRTDTERQVAIPVGFAIGPVFFQTGVVINTIEETQNGSVFTGNLAWSLERWSLGANLSRSLVPSSLSGMTVSDTFSAGAGRRFGDHWSLDLSAGLSRTRNTGNAVTAVDRDYLQAGAVLRRQVDRDWDISAAWRFGRSTDGRAGTTAESNSVSLTLSYRWPGFSVSR